MPGYLGKISAIVAVNTADFAPKLNQCAKAVEQFAKKVERDLSSSLQASSRQFGQIYTDVQKLERAIRAAGAAAHAKGLDPKLAFTGIKGLAGKDAEQAETELRRMHEVASQLSKPFENVRRTIESLRIEVQGNLHDAFRDVQSDVAGVQTEVEIFGDVAASSLDAAIRRTEQLANVASRAKEAMSMVGGLATGEEFRFAQPRMFAALQGSSRSQQAYEGEFGQTPDAQRYAATVSAAARMAEQAAARVDAAKMRGDSAAAAAGQADVDYLTGEIEKANRERDLGVRLAGDLRNLDAAIIAQAEKLLALEQQRLQVLTKQPQTVAQLDRQYQAVLARAGALDAAQRAAVGSATAGNTAAIMGVLSRGDDAGVAGVQADLAAFEAAVAAQEKFTRKTEEATKKNDALKASLRGIADSIGEPADPVDRLKQAVDRMNSSIDKIKSAPTKAAAQSRAAAIRRDIEAELAKPTPDMARVGVLTGYANKLTGAANAAGAKTTTTEDVFGKPMNSGGRAADNLKTKIISLQGEFDKLPDSLMKVGASYAFNKLRDDMMALPANATSAQVKKLENDFRNLQRLTRSLDLAQPFEKFVEERSGDTYAWQLEAVRRKLLEVGASATGKAAAALQVFQNELAKATANGTLGSDDTRAGLRKSLLKVADKVVEEGKMTKVQARSFIGGVMRSGDVGRFGADKFSLAMNQAAFVVDDFMSSTGGLDMKLRAIGNNLTQIGFLLGSTTGLWISLGAVMATTVGIMVYKWINGTETAEDKSKALNDTLANQKSTVEQLAQAYSGLAQSIAASTNVQRGLAAGETLSRISEAAAAARQAKALGLNPNVIAEKAKENELQRKLGDETTPAGAAAILNAIGRSQKNQRIFANASDDTLPNDTIDRMRTQMNALSDALMRSRASLLERINSLIGQGSTAAIEKQIETVGRGLRAAEAELASRTDKTAVEAASRALRVNTVIEEAGKLLASALEAGVPGALAMQASLDDVSVEMRLAAEQLQAAMGIKDEQKRFEAVGEATKRLDAAAGRREMIPFEMLSAGLLGGAPTAGSVLGGLSASPLNDPIRRGLADAAAEVSARQTDLAIKESALAQATTRAEEIRRRLNGVESQMTANQREALKAELDAVEEGRKAAAAARSAAMADLEHVREADRLAAAQAQYTLALRESTRAERGRVARGRMAAMTPEARQAAEFAGGEGGDVASAAGEIIDPKARARFIQDYFSGKVREQFASVFASQAADRQLAITRGGQARALEASDITTDQGSRELSRLLRGEDSAKNVENEEMRQQTDLLKAIADGIKQATGQVVDFKF